MIPATVTTTAPDGTTAGQTEGPAHRLPARRARRRWVGLLFILPALAIYSAFVIFPVGKTIHYSLYQWDGIGTPEWVGLQNYRDAFATPLLRSSIVHAFQLIIFFSLVPVAAGLALTALIARGGTKRVTAYRLIFFIPYVIPMVATGLIWRWMYTPNGVVNQVLSLIGLNRFTRAWLGDIDVALYAIGLVGSWTLSGFCMMLFLAGAQRIDTSLYEAAMLDGAGRWWQFRAVTLPGLRREISVALVVTTIAALATFDLVYVTTNGAPFNSTVVPSLLVYRLAFREQAVGQGAALAVILTVLVVVVVVVLRRISRERP